MRSCIPHLIDVEINLEGFTRKGTWGKIQPDTHRIKRELPHKLEEHADLGKI